MQKNRRSKIYIRPDVQNSFIKFLVSYWLINFSMTIAFIFFILMTIAVNTGDTMVLNLVLYHLSENIILVFSGFLIFATVKMSFGYWFFRSFTTKICGPVYNIHTRIQEYLNGQKDVQIRVRKNDFYQDFVADLNKVLKKTPTDS